MKNLFDSHTHINDKYFDKGNNRRELIREIEKSDIAYAMDCGVGYFVVDNVEELDAIDSIAKDKNIIQERTIIKEKDNEISRVFKKRR